MDQRGFFCKEETIMQRRNIIILVVLAVLGIGVLCRTAWTETLQPLPTDSNITMYAATSGTFVSMYTQATRQMEVSMDLAAYTLSEAPSISTMGDHMFMWATTPEEADWGLFAPTGDTVTLVLHVVDSQKRLGKVVVKDFTSGNVVGEITASADHGSVQGNLTITWSSEYYQMTGQTPQGGMYSRCFRDALRQIRWYRSPSVADSNPGVLRQCPANTRRDAPVSLEMKVIREVRMGQPQ